MGAREDIPVEHSPSGPRPRHTGLHGHPRAERITALRAALQRDQPLVLPGVATGLMARQVERGGFDGCYLTGAGVANLEFGLPDVGLISLGEVAEQTRRVTSATTLPLVADADTGYGGPVSVMRTVRQLEDAGAAGIQLEDQTMPKRCGHFNGKTLVPVEEMAAKIEAACAARTDGTVVIARTDARGVEGLDAALTRAEVYATAGADVLFVEAPETLEELKAIPAAFPGIPLVANIVEGGRTPELSVAELGGLGYRIVLFANLLIRVMARATDDALEHLRTHGSSRLLKASMLEWDERQELVGKDIVDGLEDRFRSNAATYALREGEPA